MFVQLKKAFLGKPTGERIDVSEEDARALIAQGVAETVAGDPLAPLIAKAMESGMTKLSDGLNQAVDLSVKQLLAGHARKAGIKLPFAGQGTGREDDPTAGFRNFGDFAQAVKKAAGPSPILDERLALVTKAAAGMGEAFGSDGGFLVPPEFSTRLLERIYAQPNLLGMTDSYTTAGNSMHFPRNAETSRANGSRWGGVRGYWREEGDQATASKPAFGKLQMNLHKLFVMVYATDELLADVQGGSLEQYLYRVATDEIGFLVNDAIVNGSGAGQPLGILGSACTVSVAKESGQAAGTLLTDNVVKMWGRLWAPCRSSAVWLINQDVEPQMHLMTVGVGTGGVVTYLPPGGISAKPYATLLGRPVLPIEQCATLGTAGDIILADLQHYVTLTRGRIETAMSMHLRFDYDESTFRFIFRIDGQPWWASALTPYKGSNTQSCFVTLATRS